MNQDLLNFLTSSEMKEWNRPYKTNERHRELKRLAEERAKSFQQKLVWVKRVN